MEPPASARRGPRVVVLRGHQANPWELAPWQEPAVAERYDVRYLRTRRGWFDPSRLTLPSERATALRDLLPPGAAGDLAVRLPGDRYLRPASHLSGAAIVHSQELGYWYSAQAARLKRRLGFKLALTVWETLPFLGAYRNVRTRPYRELVLRETDLFLATTARARDSLVLEGAPVERIRICPPGVDTARFAGAARAGNAKDAAATILSPGRLVWEKGHQDVLRALALLRARGSSEHAARARVLIVGRGPEEQRLRRYAGELGLSGHVELRGFMPYEEMPPVYAGAACLVLGSLPTTYWEEQFGMVLAEAMAAGLPVLASSSGAIPEVTGGRARLFTPGDWVGLADLIEQTLEDSNRAAAAPEPAFSTAAAAAGLAAAYEELLSAHG